MKYFVAFLLAAVILFSVGITYILINIPTPEVVSFGMILIAAGVITSALAFHKFTKRVPVKQSKPRKPKRRKK